MDWLQSESGAWASAFAMTLIIEVPVVVAAAKVREHAERSVALWLLAAAAICCSAITHPLLWFVWRPLIADYTLFVISGETLVVAAEALILFAVARPITLRRAAAVSLVANAASWAAGAGFHALFG